MKVLVGAFACRPDAGSEPGAGWAIARGAALAGLDVTLLTARFNQSAIELAMSGSPSLLERLHPVYIGLPRGFYRSWTKVGRPGRHLHYLFWQLRMWRVACRLHATHPFDVGHHATLASDWMPAGMAWVPDLPVVLGPVGGAERVPPACRVWLGWRGRTLESVRSITADPMRAIFGARSAHRADLVITQNAEAAARLAKSDIPAIVHTNVFIDTIGDGPPRVADPRPASTRHAVFAGRLLGWKGVHLAVAVMADPRLRHWDLEIFGDGPERHRLMRRIDRLGLTDRVHLRGVRPRDEVLRALTGADALLYPSMRDAASWTVGEAQMVGCPVVCLSTGGPAALIQAGGGIGVPPEGPLVDNLVRALLASSSLERAPKSWSSDALTDLLPEWYDLARRNRYAGGSLQPARS